MNNIKKQNDFSVKKSLSKHRLQHNRLPPCATTCLYGWTHAPSIWYSLSLMVTVSQAILLFTDGGGDGCKIAGSVDTIFSETLI